MSLVRPKIASRTYPDGAATETFLDFATTFRDEFSYVWNTLSRMGIASRDLEDVTHDVFVNVCRQWTSYDPSRPIKPWLFGFSFRIASDYRRLARHRREVMRAVPDPEDRAPLAIEMLIGAEERARLEAALQEVKLEHRAVLMLHDIDGFAIPDVARELGMPLNTAYSRLRLAREELARTLGAKQRRGTRHAR